MRLVKVRVRAGLGLELTNQSQAGVRAVIKAANPEWRHGYAGLKCQFSLNCVLQICTGTGRDGFPDLTQQGKEEDTTLTLNK